MVQLKPAASGMQWALHGCVIIQMNAAIKGRAMQGSNPHGSAEMQSIALGARHSLSLAKLHSK
jgi:hypothetical protein